MWITRSNYEEYFLDYLDGNLKPALEQEFHDFLASNPDLKEELAEIENEGEISIQPTNAIFNHKEALKQKEFIQPGQPENIEITAIAYIENDLSTEEKKEFEQIATHDPSVKKSLLLFQKTKLVADTSVVYKEKSALKRVLVIGLTHRNFYKAISIAASLLLILSLYFLTGNNNGFGDSGQFSQQKNTPSTFHINDEEITNIPFSYDDQVKPIAMTIEENELADMNDNLAKLEDHLDQKKDLANLDEGLEKKKTKESEKSKEKTVKEDLPQIDFNKTKDENRKPVLPNSKKLKKIGPQDLSPAIQKKANPTKRIVRPVEIHSEDLLASVSENKNDDNKYLTLRQLTTRFFKKKVLKQKEEKIDNHNIDFWQIADAGVKGLNKVTKRNLKLVREYNTEGELIAYAVESPFLSFEKTMKSK